MSQLSLPFCIGVFLTLCCASTLTQPWPFGVAAPPIVTGITGFVQRAVRPHIVSGKKVLPIPTPSSKKPTCDCSKSGNGGNANCTAALVPGLSNGLAAVKNVLQTLETVLTAEQSRSRYNKLSNECKTASIVVPQLGYILSACVNATLASTTDDYISEDQNFGTFYDTSGSHQYIDQQAEGKRFLDQLSKQLEAIIGF